MQPIEPTTYALKSYQAILEKHGHRRAEIYKRMHIARCIISSIPKGLPSNLAYRRAVDAVLMTMPDEAAAETCRTVARDFYPFYEQDLPTIAAMAQMGAFECLDDINVQLPPHRDLDDLINVARATNLSAEEQRLLDAYTQHLRMQGVDAKVLDNRVTICRLLLLGLRGLQRDGKHYRAVIDKILPLFTREETRAYFLVVARQFYSFLQS